MKPTQPFSALAAALLLCVAPVPVRADIAATSNLVTTTSTAPAQSPASAPAAVHPGCLAVTATHLTPLLGQWTVVWHDKLAGEPDDGRLAFTRNPDFDDSLIGLLALGSQRREIAGDIEEDLLTLEESSDGQRISANWSLRATPGLCSKEWRGQWIRAADGAQRKVTLQRTGKW